jgi:ring-1,2-phenylacetyl-CoA epoxidase subunit PaaD
MVAPIVIAPDRIPLLPIEEAERRQRRAESTVPGLWLILDQVKDPEIPVISIWELGVLQDIALRDGQVVVTITPTYSGCPAMTVMAEDIAAALAGAGYPDCEIVRRLSPAWSTSWIAESAQDALLAYGIAPPGRGSDGAGDAISCPRCASDKVRNISEFGSTACKALYQCLACGEPFDYFKPI